MSMMPGAPQVPMTPQAPQAGGLDLSMLQGMDLSQLTPEQIQELAAMGALEDEQGMLGEQMEMANQLRNAEGPQGRETRGGYTAANPLEHLASGMQRVKAAKDLEQYKARQQEIMGQQTGGREQFMQMILADALKKQGAGNQPLDRSIQL